MVDCWPLAVGRWLLAVALDCWQLAVGSPVLPEFLGQRPTANSQREPLPPNLRRHPPHSTWTRGHVRPNRRPGRRRRAREAGRLCAARTSQWLGRAVAPRSELVWRG